MRRQGLSFIVLFALSGVATATVLSPQFVQSSRRVIISEDGYNIRDCTPPVFHNGTWHVWATRIPVEVGKSGYDGVVAHYYSRVLNATWTFDAIALDVSANHSEWDSHGVFTPGVVYDNTVDTWYMFYVGVGQHYEHHQKQNFSTYQGLATSQSPFGAFTKSRHNPIITTYGPPTAQLANSPPPPTCAVSPRMDSKSLQGAVLSHGISPSASDCEARCQSRCSQCRGYTWTPSQQSGSKSCAAGTPCCWLKSSTEGTQSATGCVSATVSLQYPPGYYDWVRMGNPRPVVLADGRRWLISKCVQLNFTALPSVFEPARPLASWEPPYAPRADASPLVSTNASLFPLGFENQEIFMGPDGLAHLMGQSHGDSPAGHNVPHFVSANTSLPLDWSLVEMHSVWSEPAPVRATPDGVPTAFVRFEGDPLAISLYAITWNRLH